jgi:hypothetical protein
VPFQCRVSVRDREVPAAHASVEEVALTLPSPPRKTVAAGAWPIAVAACAAVLAAAADKPAPSAATAMSRAVFLLARAMMQSLPIREHVENLCLDKPALGARRPRVYPATAAKRGDFSPPVFLMGAGSLGAVGASRVAKRSHAKPKAPSTRRPRPGHWNVGEDGWPTPPGHGGMDRQSHGLLVARDGAGEPGGGPKARARRGERRTRRGRRCLDHRKGRFGNAEGSGSGGCACRCCFSGMPAREMRLLRDGVSAGIK